jgi:hypothetical protein
MGVENLAAAATHSTSPKPPRVLRSAGKGTARLDPVVALSSE